MSTHAREFEAFPPWRRGYARFLPDPLKGFAKRFVTDVEPIVALHLPSEIEARFVRFSNPELLAKANSQAMLAQLRRSESAAVRRVVEMIDRYNAGLEQEALLIQA